MAIIRQELAEFGRKIEARGLTAGAGGNISAREGRLIWVKPSGFSMGELNGRRLCCIDPESGTMVEGPARPTSELPLHLAVYRQRLDVAAIFHTHSPWASGVISSGADIRPMFAEVVNDLGNIAHVPYVTPGGVELAEAVAEAAREHDTIFMSNHGVVALGRTMKQAFYRCCVAEDAAKSLVAARLAGTPQWLSAAQIAELKGLESGAYRTSVAEAG
jgi:L-fuculose-phosphate aldolase